MEKEREKARGKRMKKEEAKGKEKEETVKREEGGDEE